MYKRVYISADYSISDGDRDVIDTLHQWADDNRYKVDYVDTAEVVSGSVSGNPDCRPCELKDEFNKQINVSSYVIFIIGDKTAWRKAGDACRRQIDGANCTCTPYKKNALGTKKCKVCSVPESKDVSYINSYSYLQHEWEQAIKKNKNIIIFYNALDKHPSWLPLYMKGYKDLAVPFWIKNVYGSKVGNYKYLKQALGYE